MTQWLDLFRTVYKFLNSQVWVPPILEVGVMQLQHNTKQVTSKIHYTVLTEILGLPMAYAQDLCIL